MNVRQDFLDVKPGWRKGWVRQEFGAVLDYGRSNEGVIMCQVQGKVGRYLEEEKVFVGYFSMVEGMSMRSSVTPDTHFV